MITMHAAIERTLVVAGAGTVLYLAIEGMRRAIDAARASQLLRDRRALHRRMGTQTW